MRVPVGRKYTASIKGKKWIPLECDFCGCNFFYEYKQEFYGTGSSLLWLDNEGAEYRAAKNAEAGLEKKFNSKINLVVYCPDCGKYSKEMIRKIKLEKTVSIAVTALVFLSTAAFVTVPWAFTKSNFLGNFFIAILFGIFVITIFLGSRIDPNKKANERKGKNYSVDYPVEKNREIVEVRSRFY